MDNMQSFTTDDGLLLRYLDTAKQSTPSKPTSSSDELKKPTLILIHGFTGSHLAWKRNIPFLSQKWRVIAMDLRGHGVSDGVSKERLSVESAGVVRLARDLRGLIEVLAKQEGKEVDEWRGGVMGGSLGCAVVWAYAHLYTTASFTHTIFVDQSPLQNQIPGSWDPPYCHKGLRNSSDFEAFSKTITTNPEKAHLGTIHSCLGYLSHPISSEGLSEQQKKERYENDKSFFLTEAMKGSPDFYVTLMGDHTALDHRSNISKAFGAACGSRTKVLVIASSRSGCFEPEGVLSVAGFVNGDQKDGKGLARGEIVDWGGHWCYWEDPKRFDELVLDFLDE